MPPPQFQGQKILITGASGFIGSHLCSRLIGSGAEVHVVSRIRRFGNDGGLIRWHGDMADTATVRTLFKTIKPDVIFHLAGHVAGSRNLDVVMPTFQSNLMSTVNILTSASEVGCRRIVLPGSLEEPEAGDLETVPSSPYAAAKWAGGAYARMFHKLYGLPVVILRIFMVYGPAQKDLNKLVPYVTLSLLKNFRDGFFPFIGAEIKEYFEQLKRNFSPDIIFTHYRNDLHQDHRLICELTWNTFRDHLILEYEIPKYDGDLGSPNFFFRLDEPVCRRKARYILDSFETQRDKRWFTEDAFLSLLRIRGIESNSPGKYAEAFYCRKMVF